MTHRSGAQDRTARHVRKMRKIYGERREILGAALARFCGARLRIVGIGAGLHLAAQLDASVPIRGLIERARGASVALDAMQRFAVGGRMSPALVFGYGAIGSDNIVPGVRLLARLMK